MMLPRIISRSSSSSRFIQTLILPKSQPISSSSSSLPPCLQFQPTDSKPYSFHHRFFSSSSNNNSSNNNGGGGGRRDSDFWNLSAAETADRIGIFQKDWSTSSRKEDEVKPWSLRFGDDEKKESDVFDLRDGGQPSVGDVRAVNQQQQQQSDVDGRLEEQVKLEMEKKRLEAVLKGPDRAFGDLIAASGITDDMLDSLMVLKDFRDIEGLPPLEVLEDLRYEKTTRKSTRSEIERQKQEDIAKVRVRMVDDQGRAYGTGRRKTSVARVWIQPGDGKFVVNDREFDVYFPMIDQRAALLRPFTETKTLGLWNVKCTVKGGGTTGQVGAVRLGISRALQNWEPGLRPALKEAGFMRRDPRAVERKKPGKAKARKSFQWVKR